MSLKTISKKSAARHADKELLKKASIHDKLNWKIVSKAVVELENPLTLKAEEREAERFRVLARKVTKSKAPSRSLDAEIAALYFSTKYDHIVEKAERGGWFDYRVAIGSNTLGRTNYAKLGRFTYSVEDALKLLPDGDISTRFSLTLWSGGAPNPPYDNRPSAVVIKYTRNIEGGWDVRPIGDPTGIGNYGETEALAVCVAILLALSELV